MSRERLTDEQIEQAAELLASLAGDYEGSEAQAWLRGVEQGLRLARVRAAYAKREEA